MYQCHKHQLIMLSQARDLLKKLTTMWTEGQMQAHNVRSTAAAYFAKTISQTILSVDQSEQKEFFILKFTDQSSADEIKKLIDTNENLK